MTYFVIYPSDQIGACLLLTVPIISKFVYYKLVSGGLWYLSRRADFRPVGSAMIGR